MLNLLSKIMSTPQRLVDGRGMYRVVSASLLLLVVISLGAGFIEAIAYSAQVQLVALVPALAIGLVLNIILAKVLQIHANHESALITILILFFLVIPQPTLLGNWALYLAVVLGVLSKFFLTYRKQHVVNPAAAGAVLVALCVWLFNLTTGTSYSTDIFSWWVSNPTFFWPVLILGSLVVLKVRKWTPVLWFVCVGLVVFLYEEWRFFGADFVWNESAVAFFLSWPALFLAFFMLTEPFTMPPTKRTQAFYGALVGALAYTTLFKDLFPMTPELALVMGNLFAYQFTIRRKLFLEFESKREVAKDTFEFVFKKPADFYFKAGQYLEWMLPHSPADGRGERRYFTIASSPTEDKVRLALKFVPNGSSYKAKLKDMQPGEFLIASQLAGDFQLPKDSSKKLGFIAGGIGITPFRSHIQYLTDTSIPQDTVLLYCTNTEDDLAYLPEFTGASEKMPLKTIPVIAQGSEAKGYETGFVTKDVLENRVPDYRERYWYLSGPPPMVNAYDSLLKKSGVPTKQIIKDFFPGLA